ncbi:MAG: FtsW/RodA/SpoVE family cell cycle protein [Planctomycetota bacterium]
MSATTELNLTSGEPTRAARLFLATVLILVGAGLVLLFSASSFRGSVKHGDLLYYFASQMQGLVLGLGALFVFAQVRPERWLRLAPPFLAVVTVFLVAVLFSDKVNGARRWLSIGISFQPSELAKIALPLFLAWTVHKAPFLHISASEIARPELEPWRARWKAARGQRVLLRLSQLMVVGIVGGLIAIEPDWGTAAFVIGVSTALLVLSRIPWQYFGLAGLASIPCVGILLQYRDRGELLQRFDGFLDPQSVYQVWQSLLGIGSGGWFGKGIGNGAAKTLFLPEEYNDFIFAVLAEETGFAGVVVLVALFSVLLQTGWRVARDCPHPALRLFGMAIVLNLVLQATINIAVATASAPTKGIGLPFLSYGSTGLSIALGQVGILIAISKLRNEGQASP